MALLSDKTRGNSCAKRASQPKLGLLSPTLSLSPYCRKFMLWRVLCKAHLWGTDHLNKPQIACAVTSSCKLAHKCAGVVLAYFRVVEKTSLLKLSLSAVKIMKNLVSARGNPCFSYL